MGDSCLQNAIELVDQTRSMTASDAARYLLDRYRAASASSREAIVLALAGALATNRRAAQGGGQ